ncbi:MAG TPA: 4Fe-4S binding protein [Candidatus Omnitrophica bacterium]|nr:4Fe-4S binding protein [Candidatus Omnitrophota bacterium]
MFFKRVIIFFAFVTVGIALAYNYSHRLRVAERPFLEIEFLKEVFPLADNFSQKKGSPPHYEAYKDKRLIGFCFLTTDIAPEIRGYGGPIQIMVGMDLEGKITGVEILQHNETPVYVQEIYESWFTEQFKGKDATDKLLIGEDLDGITQATITTTAIAQGVRKSVNIITKEVLHKEIAKAEVEELTFWERWQLFLLGTIFVVALVGFFRRKRWLRYFVLICALIFIGFYKNNFLSLINIINSLTGRFPPLPHGSFWYLLAGLILVSTIFWGRFYCGWLCPFGAIEEIIHRKRYKLQVSSLESELKRVKYFLVWIAIILALVLDNVSAGNYEPFTVIFNQKGSTLLVSFLIGILFFSLFYYRFWCRYFCPVGAVLGLVSSLSIWKLRSGENCTFCQSCLNNCPMQAIEVRDKEKITINHLECIHCNECIGVCRQGSLNRRRRGV